MGHHAVNRRVPGTCSTGIDGVYSCCAWSGTAFNISTHPDFRSKHLPHKHIPEHPQAGNNPAYDSHSLASIVGYRDLCPIFTGFHGGQVRAHIPFWARACFQCNACLVADLLPGCALIVEAVVHWQRRHGWEKNEDLRGVWLLGVVIAVPAVVVPPVIAHALAPV